LHTKTEASPEAHRAQPFRFRNNGYQGRPKFVAPSVSDPSEIDTSVLVRDSIDGLQKGFYTSP
jgi:hypothetical protein